MYHSYFGINELEGLNLFIKYGRMNVKNMIDTKISDFKIRFAEKEDTKLILDCIKELVDYEKLLDEVVATEEILYDSLFVKNKAEVIIG